LLPNPLLTSLLTRSSQDKSGVVQSLLDSDEFIDMDADEEVAATFSGPSVFASCTSSSVTVVSSPSDALETIGVSNLSPHDLVYVVDLSNGSSSHPPESLTIAAMENLAKSDSPASLTVVTIGSPSSASDSNVQDKVS